MVRITTQVAVLLLAVLVSLLQPTATLRLSASPLSSHIRRNTLQHPPNTRSRPLPTSSAPSLAQKSLLDSSGGSSSSALDLPQWIQNTNKFTISLVKSCLQLIYGNRHYARFAALETIARVPYFSYTSVLHLYETMGWFRQKEYIQIHFAESWNELHHLLIMEHLGGSDIASDRLVAQNIAFFYYWIVVALYMVSPAVAYDLNKHVEQHAFESYDAFIKEHEIELKSQPAPAVAVEYYEKGDLYMFDAFQYNEVNRKKHPEIFGPSTPRRPVIKSLYDVFCNIREDEREHADTMQILQRKSTSLQWYHADDVPRG